MSPLPYSHASYSVFICNKTDITFRYAFYNHLGRRWWLALISVVIRRHLRYNDNKIHPFIFLSPSSRWCLALMSVVMIPIVLVYKLIFAEGTLKERWINLTTPILKPHQIRPGDNTTNWVPMAEPRPEPDNDLLWSPSLMSFKRKPLPLFEGGCPIADHDCCSASERDCFCPVSEKQFHLALAGQELYPFSLKPCLSISEKLSHPLISEKHPISKKSFSPAPTNRNCPSYDKEYYPISTRQFSPIPRKE